MDEPVVDDGAADLLVELEQRLHLVHRDFVQFQKEKREREGELDQTTLQRTAGKN